MTRRRNKNSKSRIEEEEEELNGSLAGRAGRAKEELRARAKS